MPGTALGPFHSIADFILDTILWGWYCYYIYPIDEEMEAKKGLTYTRLAYLTQLINEEKDSTAGCLTPECVQLATK